MAERQKHEWIGWGWDETICKHCRVNVYIPFSVRSTYCDEYPAEKERWERFKQEQQWRREEDHY
jgi:hypothetical protein